LQSLVSVIIVNRQGKAVIEDCLLSLRRQIYCHLETIVVDNGSTDGSAALIEGKFGDFVHLIRNPTNPGFAGGNNVEMRIARGQYIALLNNDATVDPHWVEELVKAAESDPKNGMCASKIYFYDEPGILDSAGGLLIYRDGLSRGQVRLELDQGQYDAVEEVLLPSGCACLHRRAMLDEKGFFQGHLSLAKNL
jgi:GT2 family glycosyltransferase